jgi:hypothetical protein
MKVRKKCQTKGFAALPNKEYSASSLRRFFIVNTGKGEKIENGK